MKNRSILVAGLFFAGIVALAGCTSKTPDQVRKNVISTENAPAAIGPYSQAVLVGNTLYCSGQIAIDPKTGELVVGNIQVETEQVLKNIRAVLEAAGMGFGNVVKATVYMKDISNYKAINQVYAKYFTKKPPARAAVQVANLPKNVNLEISVIAVR